LRENSGKLGIMIRIYNLDLHHFHFVSAPEFFLSGPLVSCRPSPFLEEVEQGEKISSLSLDIKSRSEGIFESAKPSILILDPKNHRRLQGIKIKKPTSEFHLFTQLLVSSE
jgi:hypothetical protein